MKKLFYKTFNYLSTKEKIFYWLFILCITLIIGLPFFLSDKIIYGSDLFPFWITPLDHLRQMLSAYDDYTMAFGMEINYFPMFIPITFLALLLRWVFSFHTTNQLIYAFYSIAPFLMMNLFCLKQLKDNKNKYVISLLISVFFIFNLTSQDVFYNGYLPFRTVYFTLPMTGYLFLKFFVDSKVRWWDYILILILIVFSILSYSHPVVFLFNLLFIPIFIFLIAKWNNQKFFSTKILSFLFLIILPAIMAATVYYNSQKQISNSNIDNNFQKELTKGTIVKISNYKFNKYLQFYPVDLQETWGLDEKGNPEMIYQDAMKYTKNPYFIFFSFTTFFLFLFMLYLSVKQKNQLILSLATIIVLQLLLLGIHRLIPLNFDFTNIFYQIFRNIPNKIAPFIGFSFSLFFIFSLSKINKIGIKIFLYIYLCLLLIFNNYAFNGNIIYRHNKVNFPEPYLDSITKINDDNKDLDRIVYFPFNTYSWTELNWGFNGYDPLLNLISGPKINQNASGFTSLDNFVFEKIHNDLEEGNFSNLAELLKLTSCKYLIFKEDISLKRFPGKSTYMMDESKAFYDYLINNNLIELFDNNNYFKTYKLKEYNPRISSEDNIKINASKTYPIFLISVKAYKENDKFQIQFNDNFSKNWKLYLNPYLVTGCSEDTNSNFTVGKKTECNLDTKIIQLTTNDLKPIVENNPKELFEGKLINNWSINKKMIVENTEKDKYIVNEDGSISLQFFIYNSVQSKYNIGIFILILLTAISFLCFVYFYKFKKRHVKRY